VANLKRITAQHLKATHQRWFQPSESAEFIGSGPLTASQAAKHLEARLGVWLKRPKMQPGKDKPDVRPPAAPRRTVLVDVPDTSQTAIYLVSTAPGPKSESDVANRAAVHVLGGGFTSRLMQQLRETKGYTYGASASLEAHPDYRMLWASTSVEQSVTGDAIVDLFAELERFKLGSISDSERTIADAAQYTASIGLVETGEGLVGTYEWAQSIGLGWDTVRQRYANRASLSTREISDAARTVLDDQRTVLVLAGDLGKIRPQLQQVRPEQLGVIEVLQIDVN
jgi:zinc protease